MTLATEPANTERLRLFQFLKITSSLTAWRYGAEVEQAFVNAFESMFNKVSADGNTRVNMYGQTTTILNSSEVSDLLTSHASFGLALRRLSKGDRFCFRFARSRGHFTHALQAFDSVRMLASRQGWGEGGFPVADTPYWAIVQPSYIEFAQFYDTHHLILEPYIYMAALNLRLEQHHLAPYLNYAAAGEIPTPEHEVLVHWRDRVPAHGIYEPVKFEMVRSTWRLLGSKATVANNIFEPDGCIHYLTAGSKAPGMPIELADGSTGSRTAVWRLLWRDDRYKDGVVPDEERDYGYPKP